MKKNRIIAIIIVCLMATALTFFNAGNVRASAPQQKEWRMSNGNWYCYSNGNLLKNSWTADSRGWCFLDGNDGSMIRDSWKMDSHGWCYIGPDGYWVDHGSIAKDSLGWCIIGSDGYWTGERLGTTEMPAVGIAENAASVVFIEARKGNSLLHFSASGCIVSGDGRIITNYHVIGGADNVKVILQDGSEYEAEGLLGYSKELDIAILKLRNAENLRALQLGDSDKILLGEDVIAIGNPEGYRGTISEGIISGLHRMNSNLRLAEDIQISAPISDGSSGGGLFNMQGQLIGITYAQNSANADLNFAIPINQVKPYLDIKMMTSFSQLTQ
ncbi:MAG: trypsin-like peptidase domain-containing protein [Clostridiaceae bacterium]